MMSTPPPPTRPTQGSPTRVFSRASPTPPPKEEINSSLKCECNYSNQYGSLPRLNCQGCSLKINGNLTRLVENPIPGDITRIVSLSPKKKGGSQYVKNKSSKRNTKNNRTKRKKLKSKVQKRKQPKRITNKYK